MQTKPCITEMHKIKRILAHGSIFLIFPPATRLQTIHQHYLHLPGSASATQKLLFCLQSQSSVQCIQKQTGTPWNLKQKTNRTEMNVSQGGVGWKTLGAEILPDSVPAAGAAGGFSSSGRATAHEHEKYGVYSSSASSAGS